LETDSTGVVSRTFGQFPYGETWYETGTASKWKFTSYERDTESGLDYAMFRYDSTRIGRFTSPDPLAGSIGNPQSLNRYAYVLNDPVNLVDPLGLVPPWLAAIDGGSFPIWSNGGSFGCSLSGISVHCGTFDAALRNSSGFDPLNLHGNPAADGTWIVISEWHGEGRLGALMYYPDPFSGGGGGRIARIIRQALENAKLNACIKEIFGIDFNANQHPSIDARYTSKELAEYTKRPGETVVGSVLFPDRGRGTVLIASEYFGGHSVADNAIVYTHELGNLLAYRTFTNLPEKDRFAARSPKDPNAKDRDAGAALQECIYGTTDAPK
jgi:RHS repeat-associated protein